MFWTEWVPGFRWGDHLREQRQGHGSREGNNGPGVLIIEIVYSIKSMSRFVYYMWKSLSRSFIWTCILTNHSPLKTNRN